MTSAQATISTVEAEAISWADRNPDAIATSSRADHAAVWDACLDALRLIWNGTSVNPEPAPSNDTIDAAIRFLLEMRRHDPTNTPLCIVPAPEGGIIVEWRRERQGHQAIEAVTFANDGSIELVEFRDGVAVNVQTLGDEGPE